MFDRREASFKRRWTPPALTHNESRGTGDAAEADGCVIGDRVIGRSSLGQKETTMPGIDTYIIKTSSVCNLNCSYCYYYNGADTSYRERPSLMGASVSETAVDRIIEHASARGLTDIDLTLHGGEPLIMGKKRFVELMERFDRIDEAGIATRRKCQTNGVLLDQRWVELLAERHILLGVSMDGPKEVHDEFRVDHSGHGSYERCVRGLELALATPGLATSVISVVNPNHSGAAMYEHFRGLGVKKFDFLIPEANYAHPPEWYEPLGQATPVGDFLIEVFDAWMAEDDPEVLVRILDRVVRSMLGGEARSDVIGTAPVQVAVLESDGSIEPTDNYKICEDRMTDLGLDVFANTFDDLFEHPFFDNCVRAAEMLPTACESCRYRDLCGGGGMSTRYSHEDGFARRTIYCHDLIKLYDHVEGVVSAAMPELAR
jgi:uncharacterized protein